jgi:hypothetical protein
VRLPRPRVRPTSLRPCPAVRLDAPRPWSRDPDPEPPRRKPPATPAGRARRRTGGAAAACTPHGAPCSLPSSAVGSSSPPRRPTRSRRLRARPQTGGAAAACTPHRAPLFPAVERRRLQLPSSPPDPFPAAARAPFLTPPVVVPSPSLLATRVVALLPPVVPLLSPVS